MMVAELQEDKIRNSFNKVWRYGPITLFESQNRWYLHYSVDRAFLMDRGVSVEKLAAYYINYRQNAMREQQGVVNFYLANLSQHFGDNVELIGRKTFIEDLSNHVAERRALNDGYDGQDLSAEFCAAAQNLGSDLMELYEKGIRTITVIYSSQPTEIHISSANRRTI